MKLVQICFLIMRKKSQNIPCLMVEEIYDIDYKIEFSYDFLGEQIETKMFFKAVKTIKNEEQLRHRHGLQDIKKM